LEADDRQEKNGVANINEGIYIIYASSSNSLCVPECRVG
jgi:hypothetical protein